jgi:hypothetical protein
MAGALSLRAEEHGRLIRLEVLTPNGQMAKGMVQEGQLFELADLTAGSRVGFSPKINGDSVVLAVFDLGKGQEKGAKRLLEEMTLGVGESLDSSKTGRSYRVTVVSAEGLEKVRKEPELQEAYTVPVSDRLVRLEVTLPSGTIAKGMVQEGQMFRVRSGEGKISYGFAPNLQGESPVVRVYRIELHSSGNEKIQRVEQIPVALGSSETTKSLGARYEVRILEVLEAPSCPHPKASGAASLNKATFRCCVRCVDEEACGCSADLACGSCCSGPCCPPPPV